MCWQNLVCKAIIAIFVILQGFLVYGQEYQISYLSVEDGLSHNEATSILQDDNGFMWFGTKGGLNRFDGYEFKQFKPSREQSASINESYVECLFLDSKERIWIGTKSSGLCYYDLRKDKFAHTLGFQELSNIRITSFDEDSKGNIWIGTWAKELVMYGANNDDITVNLGTGVIANAVTAVNDSLVYWGTQFGLRFLTNGDDEKEFHFYEDINEYHQPFDIVADSINSTLWIVGARLGLTRYNYADGSFKMYSLPLSKASIESFSILQDQNGHFWIGTLGDGVYKFNVDTEQFEKIDIKPLGSDKADIAYDIVLDIYQDSAGNIWIGTEDGIVKLSLRNNFQTIGKEDESAIEGLHVNTILEDRDGVLWVGTKGQGLFMRSQQGHFENIPFAKEPTFYVLMKNDVRRIYQAEDGLIWVSFDKGIYIVNKLKNDRKKLVHIHDYFNSSGIAINKTRDLVKYNDYLWLATEEMGIHVFKEDSGRFHKIHHYSVNKGDKRIKTNRINVLQVDHKNRLWAGTNKGLFQLQTADYTFRSVTELLSNNLRLFDATINCIHSAYDGSLWFGTPSSLNQLIEEPDGSFKLIEFTKNDGLANDYINAILSDKEGNIWFSTNAGLSSYHVKTSTFRNYDMSDGIGGLDFSETSCALGPGGQMYFGGGHGLSYFTPSEITKNDYDPPVVITQFMVLNEPISVSDNGILNESINNQQTLHLNHKQKEFSFEFAALDYKAPNINQYAYWLEGRDSARVMLGSRRYVSFSNLNPGDYTLHLYGTNSNGEWSELEKTIKLSIAPAPWKTLYAKVTYFALIVFIVFLIIKVVRKQEQLNQKVVMEKALRENQKRLNEDKLRFFTNIMHEIRTPLTLILGPLNELLNKDLSRLGHEFVRNKVETVHRSATGLHDLINQLLEFRKVGAEKARLLVSENNLISFLVELTEPFKEYAASQDIRFKLQLIDKELPLYFDSIKMGVIFNNLLSNAFKFAGKSGKVSLKLVENKEHVLISISNSGRGIEPADFENLFERFYQAPGQSDFYSTGIGLSLVKSYVELHKGDIEVESIPNEMTTFTIKLLRGKNHFQDEEITQIPAKVNFLKESIEEVHERPLTRPKKTVKGATILIVDDNEEIRTYLHELLADNFNVLMANDGLEAFDKLIANKPELVISDVMMPNMDGFELCQKIKTNALVSHTPVILLTAKDQQDDEVFGTRKGADAYLTKPFNTTLLLEKINMLIESRRKLSATYSDKVILAPKNEELEREDAIFLKSAIAILEKNMDNIDFKPEQLAEQLAMSYMTLNRRFKKLSGLTPGGFIRSMRLKRAAQLLIDSDLTVMEIMDSVAYLDPKSFRHSFFKEFNMTPSEYRNKRSQ